jgi:wyosine [tRNA(Phe)-imidazoG37] synthetase (radical SAM superfamily)
MKQLQIRCVLILAVLVFAAIKVTGQITMPDVLLKSSLKDQYNYIEEHTRIYEDYRAIREDMFQKLKRNVSDTLSSINIKIAGLNKTVSVLNRTIDTLRTNLASTRTRLEEMTETKNSIRVAGIEVNKTTYNNSMWTILAGLIAILLIGFLAFKRNLSAMSNTKKEFQDLKVEFETYRKTSREAREKLTMDHFNEIKRLKGGG